MRYVLRNKYTYSLKNGNANKLFTMKKLKMFKMQIKNHFQIHEGVIL